VKFWKILILGVVLRVVLMPITVHPDILGHSFAAYFFSSQGVFNIYDHLLNLPADHPLVVNFGVADIFIYPPITYFTLGLFRVIVNPLVDPKFVPFLMENVSRITDFPNYQFYLFLFKFPYLLIDVAGAYLLSSLFKDENKQRMAFILWMFNPLAIYSSFMIGQLDLLPTFFTILALYLSKKKKFYWAVVSFGIGGSYKMFPLLFILPAAFYFKEKLGQRMKLIIIGFLPFVITVLPFLSSAAFRGMVFSSKSQKMLFMQFPITGAVSLYPFILGLTIIYLIAYYSGKKYKLEYYLYSILLLIFSVTHYHPQWFLWITPFIILQVIRNSFKYWEISAYFIFSWLVLTLLFEPSLSYGMFYPINENLKDVVGLGELLGKYTNINQLSSLIRSVFAGGALYLSYKLFFNKHEG